jgi:type I restriction enzyme R subunit
MGSLALGFKSRDHRIFGVGKDARLRASAKNNPFSDFKFTYKDSVSDALVAGYDENVDFYTLLLGNEELRDKITEVYMKEVYESLRGGK